MLPYLGMRLRGFCRQRRDVLHVELQLEIYYDMKSPRSKGHDEVDTWRKARDTLVECGRFLDIDMVQVRWKLAVNGHKRCEGGYETVGKVESPGKYVLTDIVYP